MATDNESTENGTVKESKKIDINEIIDKNYSELTSEEIEAVIDWKAEVKARDNAFAQLVEEQKKADEERIAIMQAEAKAANEKVDMLYELTIANLKKTLEEDESEDD